MKKNRGWHIYILECGNGSLYTGIAKDVKKRLDEHKSGKGAKYTRSFGVKRLVYEEAARTRSGALKREAAIKRLERPEKLKLIVKNKSVH
jgi:putative endonuclease